jgi:hypothetical protein
MIVQAPTTKVLGQATDSPGILADDAHIHQGLVSETLIKSPRAALMSCRYRS